MRFFPLFLFCAATETFHNSEAVEKNSNSKDQNASEELIECSICFECVRPSVEGAMKECLSFPTDIISCKNPINPHFYHKSCIIEWIHKQTDKNVLTCPICQEVTSINVTSLIKETVFPLMTDQASFYPEFIDLIYRVLKSNIFNFLLSEDNFENLEMLEKTIKNLKVLKDKTYEMSFLLDNRINSKKIYKEEAINDFKIVYSILKTPCDTMDALLKAVERYATNDTKHEQIIMVLLVNFFAKNKLEDFICYQKTHASTSPQNLKTLEVVNNKFNELIATKEVIIDLIYSALCTDAYEKIKKISEIFPKQISYIPLLERKLTTSIEWIANEQNSLAMTKTISYCIKNSDLVELRSFLKRMIDKCFAAKVQRLVSYPYIPSNQFMIDTIADFYSSGQQQDTVEEHPWFVYDFICAKILEECPNDERLYFDIFYYAVEQEVLNTADGTKEYYFVNVLVDSRHIINGISEDLMKKLVTDDRRDHISMLLRHCFYRDNVKELFKLAGRMKSKPAKSLFTTLMKQELFLNFKNYEKVKKYKTKKQNYNQMGLWKGISDYEIYSLCKKCIQRGNYKKIASLIYVCQNMDLIKILDQQAVKNIISATDFFAHLPRIEPFFTKNSKFSPFVRHNFIQIFEMGCKIYAGANNARILLLLKYLNTIGFNGCGSFEEYKHIFKYLSQRDDAFYLLNTGRAHFSEQFNCGLAVYITKLIKQSDSFVQIEYTEHCDHRNRFDKWEMGLDMIAKDDLLRWTMQDAYTWCGKLDERDKSGKEWNPYMELEKSGTHYIETMKKQYSSSWLFNSSLTAFIPSHVVDKIKEKIKLDSKN
ncbi:hypothetical protein ENBRE01_0356 [Enteropsectra breve]|nr:hypothetical protein ENBRE01_0356 [Enteropsectra breve]